MTVSKEAIEAASEVWRIGNRYGPDADRKRDIAEYLEGRFLARPAPSQSDERKMQEAACCSDGCCLDPAKCMAGHQVVPKAYLRVVAAVRAEARLAGAAAKREACAEIAWNKAVHGNEGRDSGMHNSTCMEIYKAIVARKP